MNRTQESHGSAYRTPEGIERMIDEELGVSVARVTSITSRASSLGATSPAARVVKMGLERQGRITCVAVPDEMSMHAACKFAGAP